MTSPLGSRPASPASFASRTPSASSTEDDTTEVSSAHEAAAAAADESSDTEDSAFASDAELSEEFRAIPPHIAARLKEAEVGIQLSGLEDEGDVEFARWQPAGDDVAMTRDEGIEPRTRVRQLFDIDRPEFQAAPEPDARRSELFAAQLVDTTLLNAAPPLRGLPQRPVANRAVPWHPGQHEAVAATPGQTFRFQDLAGDAQLLVMRFVSLADLARFSRTSHRMHDGHFARALPHLKGSPEAVAELLRLAGGQSRLKSVDYRRAELHDGHLLQLVGVAPRVQVVLMARQPMITDTGLLAIAGLPDLRALRMSLCRGISDAGLVGLAGSTVLRTLCVNACGGITARGLLSLPHGLRGLDVGGTSIDSLDFVAQLKELEIFEAGGCPNISDAHVGALRALPRLRAVDLSYCRLTEVALQRLNGARLESLEMAGTGITGEGLRYIPTLLRLKVNACNRFTDASMDHVPQGVRELDVSGCPVTDAGLLRNVRRLGRLESLQVGRCAAVTSEGLFELTKIRPGLQIVSLSPRHWPPAVSIASPAQWAAAYALDYSVQAK